MQTTKTFKKALLPVLIVTALALLLIPLLILPASAETCAGEHLWNDGEMLRNATCQNEGQILYTCSACGETKTESTPAINHTDVPPLAESTWETEGKLYTGFLCDMCAMMIVTHDWGDGTVTQAPTCKDAGLMTYECADCEEILTKPIDKTADHIWGEGEVTTEYTSTTVGIMTYTCEVCNAIKQEMFGEAPYSTSYNETLNTPTADGDTPVFHGNWTVHTTRNGNGTYDYNTLIPVSWAGTSGNYANIAISGGDAFLSLGNTNPNYHGKIGTVGATDTQAAVIRYTSEKAGTADIYFDLLGNVALRAGQTAAAGSCTFTYTVYLNGTKIWPLNGETNSVNCKQNGAKIIYSQQTLAVEGITLNVGDKIDFVCEGDGTFAGVSELWGAGGNAMFSTIEFTKVNDNATPSITLKPAMSVNLAITSNFALNAKVTIPVGILTSIEEVGLLVNGEEVILTKINETAFDAYNVLNAYAQDLASEKVTIQPYYVTIDGETVWGNEFTTDILSVLQAYASSEDKATSDLAKAILNYVAEAQKHLDPSLSADRLANAILGDKDMSYRDLLEAGKAVAIVIENSNATVEFSGISMFLNNATAMKLHLALPADANINDYKLEVIELVTQDAIDNNKFDKGAATATIQLKNVDAEGNAIAYVGTTFGNMDRVYLFRVLDTMGKVVSDTVAYSPLAYATRMANDIEVGFVCKALLSLNDAIDEYTAACARGDVSSISIDSSLKSSYPISSVEEIVESNTDTSFDAIETNTEGEAVTPQLPPEASDTCVHDYTVYEYKVATCTEYGELLYVCKNNCGVSYVFPTGEKNPDRHSDLDVEVLDPTCLENGYVKAICTGCGWADEADVIPALGHDYMDSIIVTAPTCEKDGCITATCQRCGNIDVSIGTMTNGLLATGHSETGVWVVVVDDSANICLDDGMQLLICENCYNNGCIDCAGKILDTKVIAATGHNVAADWTVATAPTLDAAGELKGFCTKCGTNATIVLPKLNTTDYTYVVTTPATCTETGVDTYTINIGEWSQSFSVVTESPTTHPWNDGEITTDSTCTTQGVKTLTCTVCNETTTVYLPLKAHVYGAPAIEKKDNNFVLTFKCDNCIDTKVIICDDYTSETTPATCAADGETVYVFSYTAPDGSAATQTYTQVIPALGHSWNAGEVTTEPTPEAEGVKTYTCTVCSETKTETVAKIPAISANVLLGETFAANGKVTVPEGVVATEAGLYFDGVKMTGVLTDSYYLVEGFFKCAAKETGKTVTVQAYYVADGVEVKGNEIETSIAALLRTYLSNGDADVVALATATLNYAAAAQVYFGYDVENLVNEGLAATLPQGEYTDNFAVIEANPDAILAPREIALLLNDTVDLHVRAGKLISPAVNYAEYYLAVSENADMLDAITVAFDEKGVAIVKAISPTKWNDTYYFCIVDGEGNAVSATFSYGVSTYYARMAADDDANLTALVDAMMALYEANEAYLAPDVEEPYVPEDNQTHPDDISGIF